MILPVFFFLIKEPSSLDLFILEIQSSVKTIFHKYSDGLIITVFTIKAKEASHKESQSVFGEKKKKKKSCLFFPCVSQMKMYALLFLCLFFKLT